MVPLTAAADVDAELSALAAQGKIRLAENGLASSFWRMGAPRIPEANLLEALRAER